MVLLVLDKNNTNLILFKFNPHKFIVQSPVLLICKIATLSLDTNLLKLLTVWVPCSVKYLTVPCWVHVYLDWKRPSTCPFPVSKRVSTCPFPVSKHGDTLVSTRYSWRLDNVSALFTCNRDSLSFSWHSSRLFRVLANPYKLFLKRKLNRWNNPIVTGTSVNILHSFNFQPLPILKSWKPRKQF